MNKDVIVIVGPTASGKTDAAIRVAKQLDGEIVSADSMQIYKEMNIGTAKPTAQEMQGVPHHMLNVVSIAAPYSVALYQKQALQYMKDILSRGKTPVVAGGTGLYINSLLYELDFTQQAGDPEFRAGLEEKSGEELHAQLAEKDPQAALRIHVNDKKRLVRRLEILKNGGEEGYDFRRPNTAYNFICLGLTMDRAELYRRIELRVDKMVERGLFDEVAQIYEKNPANLIALQAIGYKEVIEYLEKRSGRAETVENIKKNTRRFAKRQFTWFNRIEGITWFQAGESGGNPADGMIRCIEEQE